MVPVIDISAKGSIILGSYVTCDGFHADVPYRAQTHAHWDHMCDFDTSKGFQKIYMSKQTKALLIAEHDADLPYRSNIYGINLGSPIFLPEIELELISSEHILGGTQVQVTLPNGIKVGYSSDFFWPLQRVIKVDQLVLDSNNGNPDRIRYYTQSEVDARFRDLAFAKLHEGPIIIRAFRGTLERALLLLEELQYPVLASKRCKKELEVYRHYGYFDFQIYEAQSFAKTNEKYIHLLLSFERVPEADDATVIKLSRYMGSLYDPILEINQRHYCVSMANHADFEGIIEYVSQTGAKYVLTDNTRGGYAIDLAYEIRKRLGIDAYPSESDYNLSWGS